MNRDEGQGQRNAARQLGEQAAKVKSFLAKVGGAAVLAGVVAIAMGYGVYSCFRIDVPPEHVAVLIKRTGSDLPNSQALASSPSQKGVQLEILTEGRYFYNPYHWDWKIVPMQVVPQGQVGVVVRLFGEDSPTGRILAERDEEKGILPTEL